MDPYEQRLRDEVIYLHSLWRQGPPTVPNSIPIPNPNPNPNPNSGFGYKPLTYLRPSISTNFKKEQKKSKGKRGKKNPPASDIEWPVKEPTPIPPASTSGWPVLNLPSAPATRTPSAEEKARFAADQLQQRGVKAVQEFFGSNADSDGDDDSDLDMEDGDDMADDNGGEEYTFFTKVFAEDDELRGYYEKNNEAGDFFCLVCGGIGEKVGKRFKGCAPLVQHSVTIAKTKKKRAHRAYGQVLCKVLNWDFNRLPTIVMLSGDPIVHKQEEFQGNVGNEESELLKTNPISDNVNGGEMIEIEVSDVRKKEGIQVYIDTINVVTHDSMVFESSLLLADSNDGIEKLDQLVPRTLDGDTEGGVNTLKSLQEDGLGGVERELKDNQKNIAATLDGRKEEDEKDQN